MVSFHNCIDKIKTFLKKYKYSPFVKEYLFTANVRASFYVSIIVALLEIWMLILMILGIIQNSNSYTHQWIVTHTLSYIGLLSISLVMLFFSIYYLRGKTNSYATGYIIKYLFALAMVAFGLYISYTSMDRGGQVFAFITVIIFVNCLLVWQPLVSFTFLTAVFLIYIYLQNKIIPISLSIKINCFTTWLAFCVTALTSHHQKRVEAQKDEELNNLNSYLRQKSTIDELTSLPNMNFFYSQAPEILKNYQKDITKLGFVFMDVENFKNYNEKYGFAAGTEFLRTIADIIKTFFDGQLIARFSDDHFVVLTEIEGIDKKIEEINNEIYNHEESMILNLKVGICRVKTSDDSPNLSCDYARYACESIKKFFGRNIIEYDEAMSRIFRQKKYIINNIDQAIDKGYIKVFYQPVVWAKNGNLCGVEALARWQDPVYGLLSPGAFIPILEEYHLIHKLDVCVMETACRDIKEYFISNQAYPIPVSINFSRLDFELLNPAEELDRCITKYGLTRSDIHVEITESALSSSDEKLKNSLETFRENGNSLWLDDFGAGYSGLNVLKDYSFDLMKIDMAFLSHFSDNQKAQPILTSIVDLAQKIGMQTLTEGVESQEAYEFLKTIGCQRLQGFLFGKPMPKEELIEKIKAETYILGD